MENRKIIPFGELAAIRARHPGEKIVQCHGVFDLLHYGHTLHLQSARKLGDLLVVTVTPDRFVNKGPGRPHHPDHQRAFILAQLEVVDYVAITENPSAVEAINLLKPDFFAKGSDYRDKQKDITGKIHEEEFALKAAGGEIVFTDDEMHSSTQILNRHFSRWDDDQARAIERLRKVLPKERMLETIDSFSKLRVLVVGEPIIDSYVFCQAIGMSSKSASIAARYINQEDYAGGSLAIANHLAALGCQVSILITHGGEEYFESLLKSSMDSAVAFHGHPTPGIPTPRKTRYLTPFRTQIMFEVVNLRADQWLHADPTPFAEKLRKLASQHDMTIVADFGHGMFEGPMVEALDGIPGFIAMNVQTNSGNFGFNPFTKHRRFDYLSIDERECRLALHDRFAPIEEIARKAVALHPGRDTSVTLGTAGSLYFDRSGSEHTCPTFFRDVIDTVGAGDAYFAITSLLVRQGMPGPMIPFVGNCFAGLKTRIIGNKSAVSKVDLVRTVQSILA